MTKKITTRIIKPSGVEEEFTSDMTVMPGSEGEFGVLYGHVPMLVQLAEGDVKIHNENEIKTFWIKAGFATITGTTVDITCSN